VVSRYLEDAAALLHKAAETHEAYYAGLSHIRGIESDLNAGRERIAKQYATLAAIDKGLFPAEMVADILRAMPSTGGAR
jgi:hypothetical protein